jgi:hypothetical protein
MDRTARVWPIDRGQHLPTGALDLARWIDGLSTAVLGPSQQLGTP